MILEIKSIRFIRDLTLKKGLIKYQFPISQVKSTRCGVGKVLLPPASWGPHIEPNTVDFQ